MRYLHKIEEKMLIDCNILLSIVIPTYNRCKYLRELLPEILKQCDQIDPTYIEIELILCDNASTDQTPEYITYLKKRTRISYYRNSENIGADANFINGVKLAKGKYVWLFGDDELLVENGISRVIRILKEYPCSLLIVRDESYPFGLQHSQFFSNYEDLVNCVSKINPHFVLAHTLITVNIFKREVFDIYCAYHCISTNYGHMYALMNNLKEGGTVIFFNEPIIIVRKHRAEFEKPIEFLGIKQIQYIQYIGKTFKNRDIVIFSYKFGLKLLIHYIYLNFRTYLKKSKIW
jgi:glycosyltransferase involved in cell wall biosynthesis